MKELIRNYLSLFLIALSCSGCRTFTVTQLEQEQWDYYKIGYQTGVACRGMLSAPACEIFLENLEEME